MTKVLITGSSGFVGKNLVPYLEKLKIEVTPLSLRSHDWEQKLVGDYDVVIHLAGKAHDLKKTSNAQDYYKVNFELTKKLYDAFLKSKAEKFIFISSVKAVADAIEGILDESHAPNPLTDYGKSKLMAETYIQQQNLPKGKLFYILRPCMIHGPNNKGNLNLLYNFVKKGMPYPLASFDNKRSFLSVENLCFVIYKIVENSIPIGVYQVADDDAISTNELIGILADSMGKKPMLWRISPTFIGALARLGDIFKLPLNTERLNKLTESYIVDNSKIKQEIKTELPVLTRNGIRETADSFR